MLEQLCKLFPGATLFTLLHNRGSVSRVIEAMQIRTSFLDRIPGINRNYRYFLPLYPWAISSFDLRGYDLILSSSHAAAKGVRKPRGGLHICYCHTPMRYIWQAQADYFRRRATLERRFEDPAPGPRPRAVLYTPRTI